MGIKKIIVPIATVKLSKEQRLNIQTALKNNWIGFDGPFTKELEREFTNVCDCSYTVFVASGSAGLHLALSALDIKDGDEVICPDFSIISIPHAVRLCGAKPVFVDVDNNGNLDPSLIEDKITPKTKAIIVVHAFGIPAEIEKILEIASRNNLYLIEDCSQAHGARFKGRLVGSFGHVAVFSLYINKLIMAGEGGIVATNKKWLAERVRRARNMYYGDEERFYHERFGWNYRATDLQAAIALPLCKALDETIRKRRKIANTIRQAIEDIKWLEFLEPPKHVSAVDWVFCVRIKDGSPIDRKELIQRLISLGVEARPLFVPFHMQPMYKVQQDFPCATNLFKSGLYVSCHQELKKYQIEHIVKAFKKAFKCK